LGAGAFGKEIPNPSIIFFLALLPWKQQNACVFLPPPVLAGTVEQITCLHE